MLNTSLLAVAERAVDWSPSVAVVMIVCNVLAIAIGSLTIKQKNVGPASGMFGGMSLAALLGSASLGHILGAGAILGLSNVGIL
jgi:photosystem I subunit 10